LISSETSHLASAGRSHPGERRQNNEDRYFVSSYRLEGDNSPSLLAIVADGIGGHRAGEIAAQIAVDTVVEKVTSGAGVNPVAQLQDAVREANRVVAQASQEPERLGMGSTLSVAWIIGHRLYITSVGDSRIYLLRRGKLRQITIDHTWVQEAIDHKIITPEEASTHPKAHVLRRYIGSREATQPDTRLKLSPKEKPTTSEANQGLILIPKDQILLCTDGLTDVVQDQEIEGVLEHHMPEQAVEKLVSLARERGGPDNITVVALAVPSGTWYARLLRARWMAITLGAAIALTCITLLTLAVLWRIGFWPWTPKPPGDEIPTTTSAPAEQLIPPTEGFVDSQDQEATATIPSTPQPSSTPYPLPTVGPTVSTPTPSVD
jgi:serine/threonine protein phosphatase PrpC